MILAIAMAALSVAGVADRFPTPALGSSPQHAYSVQMHVHGPFSEGRLGSGSGSIDSQTWEAANAGVDVIWWSEHDWRAALYHHISSYSFEDASEPVSQDEPWRPLLPLELTATKYFGPAIGPSFDDGIVSFSNAHPYQGVKSLLLSGSQPGTSFESLSLPLHSDRDRHKHPLAAGVTLGVAVWVEAASAEARPVVDVSLSQHAPQPGILGFGTYGLHYFLDNGGAVPSRDGFVYSIPLSYELDRWNYYWLDLTLDAREGFPFAVAEDNSAYAISIGIESRNGAKASAYFDEFRILDELRGPELFQRQQGLLQDIANRVPEVTQIQGTEISFAGTFSSKPPHLNEFSLQPEVLDYDALAAASGLQDADGLITDVNAFGDFIAAWATEHIHAKGGLVSVNHIFGAGGDGYPGTREQMRDAILAERAYGADLLEVGYRDRAGWKLEDYLWVWDELSKNGLPLVGNGVSDSHGGKQGHWLTDVNNLITWIYADSSSAADLLRGLRGGRAFFGDIGLFRGTLDLETPDGFRMGQIVVTDAAATDLGVHVDGSATTDRVCYVENGVTTICTAANASVVETRRPIPIDPALGTTVRVELRGSSRKVFSNPIWFVRQVPAAGIRAEQAGVNVGRILGHSFEGLQLTGVRLESMIFQDRLVLGMSAAAGAATLDLSARGAPLGVTFQGGLSGEWSYAGGILRLTGLAGQGEVVVTVVPLGG